MSKVSKLCLKFLKAIPLTSVQIVFTLFPLIAEKWVKDEEFGLLLSSTPIARGQWILTSSSCFSDTRPDFLSNNNGNEKWN